MKRAEGKKRRVTIMMGESLYAQFHSFAKRNIWSDGRAGLRLITMYFLEERKDEGKKWPSEQGPRKNS